MLKPVQPERLRKTVARLQQALAAQRARRRPPADAALEQTLAQWRQLLAGGRQPAPRPSSAAPPPRSSSSPPARPAAATVRMVPIDEVLYFEAADKYVRVLTATQEYLIRTPLKQLLPQLDADAFWQVHRAVVVRSERDRVGAPRRGRQAAPAAARPAPRRSPVSRLYAHLFRAM